MIRSSFYFRFTTDSIIAHTFSRTFFFLFHHHFLETNAVFLYSLYFFLSFSLFIEIPRQMDIYIYIYHDGTRTRRCTEARGVNDEREEKSGGRRSTIRSTRVAEVDWLGGVDWRKGGTVEGSTQVSHTGVWLCVRPVYRGSPSLSLSFSRRTLFSFSLALSLSLSSFISLFLGRAEGCGRGAALWKVGVSSSGAT